MNDKMKFMTYAIDFDDTITINTSFPEVGELNPHADRVIRRIKENGGEIAIWTCRTGIHEIAVKNFLAHHNIPYDSFNEILPSERKVWGEGGRKIFAHCYIDDKGIYAQMNGGIDWLELEAYIFSETHPKYKAEPLNMQLVHDMTIAYANISDELKRRKDNHDRALKMLKEQNKKAEEV